MIEIEVDGYIDAASVASTPVDEVEEMLHKHIGTNLSKQVMIHIDEMAFINMSLDEERGEFHYTAELVLCSKESIVTNIQRQAQLMAKHGLNEEQIEEILAIATEDTGGF